MAQTRAELMQAILHVPSKAVSARSLFLNAYDALRSRIALSRFRELGPGASIRGLIWAPGWRGTIRAGSDLQIDASNAPVELHALWGGEIRMGDGVRIEGGTSIEAQALVSIGNHVHFGPMCKVMDNDFHFNARDRRRPPSHPVIIGDGARIGAGAILLPGAHVAAGMTIAPGTVVRASPRSRTPRVPVPTPPAGLLGGWYRVVDRAFDLAAIAAAYVLLRGCQRGPRIRARDLQVEGRERIHVGEHTKFVRGMVPTQLIAHGRLSIGAFAMFNYGSRIEAWDSIQIGDRCRFGSRVEICDRGADKMAPITIGDDVWVAHGARILPGVNIGAGSVIAAGAVVCNDVPPESIAVGNPARCMSLRMVGST